MNQEAYYINQDGSWDINKSKWIEVSDNNNEGELSISVDKPYTLIPPPQPCYDPYFNHETQEWIEKGEAPEEPEEPTESELDEKQIQLILKEISALKEKDHLLEQEIELLKNQKNAEEKGE